MDLAEFLLARIADDEAAAIEAGGDTWEVADARKVRWVRNDGNAHGWAAFADLPTATEHIARWDPARVLAECEAKRRIVEGAEAIVGHEKTYAERMRHSTTEDATYVIVRDMLRSLALPYASHPDYREEWRPPTYVPA